MTRPATPEASTHAAAHVPVLLAETLAALAVRDGGNYLDGTFGSGGYTRAILEAADCRVVAIDRDPDALARGEALKAKYGARLTLVEGRFGALDTAARDAGFPELDGIALDLGVSSPQIDEPARGFSFRFDGPLDMRMEKSGTSAADIVNSWSETELADTIFQLGDERHFAPRGRAPSSPRARKSASNARPSSRASCALPCPRSKDGIDPSTRTFQALRIATNDELGELARGLAAAERVLVPGGRLAVVSFHSLEDRACQTFPEGARRRDRPRFAPHADACGRCRPQFQPRVAQGHPAR